MNENYNSDPSGACSVRSLATLLIAWVCAAIVASILLHWSYAYLALAVLTIIFLIACGYASCTSRQSQDAYVDQEQQHQNIQTVARQLDQSYFREPPRYQTYWITDLPPPYSSPMINQQILSPRGIPTEQLMTTNPPPYDAVIQSSTNPSRQFERNDAPRRSNRSQPYAPPRTSDKKLEELPVLNPLNDCVPSIIIDNNSNRQTENGNSREGLNCENPVNNR